MRNYRTAEARNAQPSPALAALLDDAAAAADAERAERMAGIIRIERGPAAFRVTFPKLGAAERGTDAARAAWDEARRPMADVKAIPGRRFDSMQAAWIVPIEQADTIALLADEYAAQIEDVALAAGLDAESAARIAELERQLAVLEAERDAAVALADEYARALEGRAA